MPLWHFDLLAILVVVGIPLKNLRRLCASVETRPWVRAWQSGVALRLPP